MVGSSFVVNSEITLHASCVNKNYTVTKKFLSLNVHTCWSRFKSRKF